MKTITKKQQRIAQAQDDTTQAAKTVIVLTLMAAGAIGLWGTACLLSALATNGIGGIVTGFMTAVTGM